jgi:hypothetical protein
MSIPSSLPPSQQSAAAPSSTTTSTPSVTKKARVCPSPFGNDWASWSLRGAELERMGALNFCATFAQNNPEAQKDCREEARQILADNRFFRFN